MLDLTVIIFPRDQTENLRLCLAALDAQTLALRQWDILVTGPAHPDDPVAQIVRFHDGPVKCRFLRCDDDAPPAAARNNAIHAARGETILFMEPDVLPAPDLVERHIQAHEKSPPSAVVGQVEWTPSTPAEMLRQWNDKQQVWDIRHPRDAGFRHFNLLNSSVRRQDLLDARGFDENYAHEGWDDLDLALRLEKKGLAVRYEPKAFATRNQTHIALKALCQQEYRIGFTAAYYFEKWTGDSRVREDRFWQDDPAALPGPPGAWRQALGRLQIRLAERLRAPSDLLRGLYARHIWTHRHQGLRDGLAHYLPLLQSHQAGEIPEEETQNRFQMGDTM